MFSFHNLASAISKFICQQRDANKATARVKNGAVSLSPFGIMLVSTNYHARIFLRLPTLSNKNNRAKVSKTISGSILV
jgi:hypothetical protein